MKRLSILSGSACESIAQKIFDEIEKIDTADLGDSLLKREIIEFANGEIGVEILETVAGADVFIIQTSVTGKVNEGVMETLLLIDASKRARSEKVYLVQLVLPYQRQDRREIKDQRPKRRPVSAKVVLNCLTKGVGVNKIICPKLHTEQIEGFTENDSTVENIEVAILFKNYLESIGLLDSMPLSKQPIVVAPDAGAVKGVRDFCGMVGLSDYIIIDKRREGPGKNEVMYVIGDCSDRDCIMFDDMIDTGGTAIQAVNALKERGAKRVYLLSTHGVFSRDAVQRLASSAFEKIVITDSIPNQNLLEYPDRFVVLSLAEILAKIILNIHNPNSFDAVLRQNGSVRREAEGVTG